MSGFSNFGIPMLKTPTAASDLFSQAGRYPRQRHAFLVRFNRNQVSQTQTNLTFVVKSCDRPQITPHVEELNQYNKKRQVYTGYKFSPVKCVFWEDAAGSMHTLWQEYSKFYFGDFNQNASSWAYDVTTEQYLDLTGSGFGVTAKNGGSSDNNSQYFFKTIDILHFYSGIYDVYTLVNPKISSFEPEPLGYDEASIGTIGVQFSYESTLYYPQAGIASTVPEFQAGYMGGFNGSAFTVPGTEPAYDQYETTDASENGDTYGYDIYSGLTPTATSQVDSRYFSSAVGSGLGQFGNFGFGVSSGASPNIPAFIAGSLYNAVNGTVTGALNEVASSANSAISSLISSAAYAAASLGGTDPGFDYSSDGAVLSDQGYGFMNSATGSGAAQYGYNSQEDGAFYPPGTQATNVSPTDTSSNGLGAPITPVTSENLPALPTSAVPIQSSSGGVSYVLQGSGQAGTVADSQTQIISITDGDAGSFQV